MNFKMIPMIAAIALLPTATLADRAPTAEERQKIEATLKTEGFVSWEEIEFDDGRFEVDDARDKDGVEYDLKLDPKTFKIVRRTRDD